MAGEHAEHDRAHDVVRAAAAVAEIVERALAKNSSQRPPASRNWEKKIQLALAGDGSLVLPFGVKAAAWSIHGPGSGGVSRIILGSPCG